MGFLRSAFNTVTRLHSRPVVLKRLGNGTTVATLYSPARTTPSNYFRYASGPAETVVTGLEFIIPVDTITGTQIQNLTFSSVPTSGEWKLTYNGIDSANFNFDADASGVQSSIRLVTGLEAVTVSGDYTDGFVFTMYGIQNPLPLTASNGGSPLDATMSIAEAQVGALPSPIVARGDRILDGIRNLTIKEIVEMPDLGGEIMGYRCRVDA